MFNGYGNFAGAERAVAGLQAQFAALQSELVKISKAKGIDYQQFRSTAAQAALMNQRFADAAASSGLFEVSQARVNSQTQEYTKLLQKQKLGVLEMIRNQGVLKAAYEEQLRLRQLSVSQFGTDAAGRSIATITVPNQVPRELDTIRNKLGFVRAMTMSASQQMINWGKNTQWAGRQLMVGLTLPMAAFGAAAGVMAFQANAGITRVQKVYNTTSTDMAGRAKEMGDISKASMDVARKAAEDYGASLKDTLDVEAQLAATGKTGAELYASTAQVMRIATLGEMDYNTALNATISLQSVFKMNTTELTKSFNYMNAVENQTSLQLSDFAAAIPIAAAPIKAMGGDIHTLGTLLVAMRERGIQAVQGANAIKSAMTRIFKPSQQVQDLFHEFTGKDLNELVDAAHGQIIPTFTAIYESVKDLDRVSKMRVLSGLFGTYQATRLNAILAAMGDIKNGAGQVTQAVQLAGASSEKLAQIAQTEINRQMNSTSGQLKKTFATLKVDLAEMGKPFLEWGARFLTFILKIVEGFNSLPSGVKKGLAFAAILAALVGPVVMLAGLFMNFWGNIVKFTGALVGLGTRFQLINKDQKIAAIMAEAAEKAMSAEARSVDMLTTSINALNEAFAQQARIARLQAPSVPLQAPIPVSMIVPAGATRYPAGYPGIGSDGRGIGGRFLSTDDRASAAAGAHMQAESQKVIALKAQEEAAAKARSASAMKMMAASGAAFTAGMVASMISSNALVDNIAKWLMILGLGAPLLMGLGKMIAAISFTNLSIGLSSYFKVWTMGIAQASAAATGFGGKLKAGTSAALLGKGAMVGWTAAIVAAGAAAYYLYGKMRSASEETRKTFEDTQGLGEIFGYSPGTTPTTLHNIKSNNPTVELQKQVSLAGQFAEKYGNAVDLIRSSIGDQAKYNQALIQGMKVLSSGGSAQQAVEATRTALVAAEGYVKAHAIMLQFGADLSTVKGVVDSYFNAAFAAAQDVQKGNPWWQHVFSTLPGIGSDSTTAGKLVGKNLALGIQQAITANHIDLAGPIIQQFNTDLAVARDKFQANPISGTAVNLLMGDSGTRFRAMAQQMGVTADQANKLYFDIISGATSVTQALIKMNGTMTTNQKLILLNAQAAKTGLGFSDAMMRLELEVQLLQQANQGKAADAIDNTNSAIERQIKLYQAQLKILQGFDFAASAKSAMTSAQSDIGSAISDQFQTNMNNAMDALAKAGQDRLAAFDKTVQARDDAFSRQEDALQKKDDAQTERFQTNWQKRIDAVNNAFAARQDAIQKEIDAETKANDLRQKMYDAEIARIQRLAEMANKQIDLNVAINTGNLDEAARVANDMQATDQVNGMQDAQQKADDASQARVDALNKEMDKEKKAQDRRLKMLQDLQDAQAKALKKEQDMRDAALKAEQEHYDKMMAMRRTVMETGIADAQKEAQASWDARKKSLDLAIQALESYIPTSEADLKKHIANIGSQYDEFGNILKQHGTDWAKVIRTDLNREMRNAAGDLKTEIHWGAIGRASALEMIKGAFGMTMAQFKQWAGMTTMPGGGKPPDQGPSQGGGHTVPSYHTGGEVIGSFGGPGLKHDEQYAKLLKGERVLNPDENRRFKATDQGGMGGPGSALGMAGIFATALLRGAQNIMGKAISSKGATMLPGSDFTAGKPGVYGSSGMPFTSEQLGNAAIIASVGSQLGGSSRDIIVALMTAMQESMLRNLPYGDADSIGLFQQRDAWGTYAQRINPVSAATMFFTGGHAGQRGLFDIPNRDSMSYAQEAQAVQVSAFPDAYAKWSDEAMDILRSLHSVTQSQGTGGWHHPMPGYHVTNGFSSTHFGNDFSTNGVIGKTVVAAGDGTVYQSYDIPYTGGDAYHDPRYGPYGSYGRVIKIDHPLPGGKFVRTVYGHNSQRLVRAGQAITGGMRIALSGSSGNSSGPHMHFETDPNGAYPGVDPTAWMSAHGVQLREGARRVRWDNTVANLHRGESVLTEPITRKMEQNLTQGNTSETVHNHYTTLEVHPAQGMDERTFANHVYKLIDDRESKIGRSRQIGR